MTVASRFAVNTCQVHGKKSYASRDLARKAIDELHDGGLRAYRCAATDGEPIWHIGHLPKPVVNGDKTAAEHYEGVTFVDGSELRYGSEATLTRRPSPLDIRPRNGHKPVSEDSIEALLVAAEASQVAAAQKLAAQIRELVATLREELRVGQEERSLREQIEALTGQLESLTSRLQQLRGEPEPADAAAPGSPQHHWAGVKQADVRAWARAQGIDVPVRGSLKPAVIEAYHQARGGA